MPGCESLVRTLLQPWAPSPWHSSSPNREALIWEHLTSLRDWSWVSSHAPGGTGFSHLDRLSDSLLGDGTDPCQLHLQPKCRLPCR